MATVEELVVSARPDGMDRTADEMENVEGQFQETADEVGNSADEMQGFATQWRGAMGAIMAGLGVAATGLLAKVPIIGATVETLNGVISALAFKIDQDLRPALLGFNNDLRKTEQDVANSENSLDAVATAILGINNAIDTLQVKTIQDFIEDLTGITVPERILDFFVNLITLDFIGLYENVYNTFKLVASDTIPIVKGWANDVVSFAKDIWNGVKKWLGNVSSDGVQFFKDLWNGIKQWLGNGLDEIDSFVSDIDEKINDLVDDAFGWGEDLLSDFIDGMGSMLGVLESFLDDIPFVDKILKLFDELSSALSDTISGNNSSSFEGITNVFNGGGGDSGGDSGFSASRGGSPNLYLDGRSLIDNTGRYRSDQTSRRGRYG